jgi:hypothetical protein
VRRIVRHRPSPAVGIALVALFFALGGSAYGLVITGRNIKNNTVTTRDIRNGTLRSRDVRHNALGPHAILESKLHVGSARSAASAGFASRAEGTTHFAVVAGNGVLARGRGLASNPVRTGKGRYQLIFDRDVRGCAYLATVGIIGATPPGPGRSPRARWRPARTACAS